MNRELYQQYVSLKEQGKKAEAQEAVRAFIASFESPDEKRQWVQELLANHGAKQLVPHEIYSELVFPVLMEGYRRSEVGAILGLAKTIQNVYRADALYAAIEYKSELTLLKEAYALEPSSEIRQRLLQANIKWFKYSQHEYPAGILYGTDGATPDELAEIFEEIAFARHLDSENNHATFLADYEQKVREYQNRLKEWQDTKRHEGT